MSNLFAIDPNTGAEFYSYNMFGGPQFGPRILQSKSIAAVR